MGESRFILREKCKDAMKYTYNAIEDMPKNHRFTLGHDIRMSMLTLYRLILRAGKKYYKKTTLQEMDIEHDTLKGLIHVAMELKAINLKEYEIISEYLVEIGKIIGGWLKKADR